MSTGYSISITALDKASAEIKRINAALKQMQQLDQQNDKTAAEGANKTKSRFDDLLNRTNNFSKLARGALTSVDKQFKTVTKSIGGTVDSLAGAFKLGGLAVAANLAVKPIETIANGFLRAGNNVNSLVTSANELKLTLGQLQRAQEQFRLYDIKPEQETQSLKHIADMQFRAKGNRLTADEVGLINRMGFKGDEFLKLPVDEIQRRILNAMFNNPAMVKEAGGAAPVAEKMLGDRQFADVISRGKTFFDEQIAAASKITTFSEQSAESFKRIHDDALKVQRYFDQMVLKLENFIAGPLAKLLKWAEEHPFLAGGAAAGIGAGAVGTVIGVFKKLAGALSKRAGNIIEEAIKNVLPAVKEAAPKIGVETAKKVPGVLPKLGGFLGKAIPGFGTAYTILDFLKGKPAGSPEEEKKDKEFFEKYGKSKVPPATGPEFFAKIPPLSTVGTPDDIFQGLKFLADIGRQFRSFVGRFGGGIGGIVGGIESFAGKAFGVVQSVVGKLGLTHSANAARSRVGVPDIPNTPMTPEEKNFLGLVLQYESRGENVMNGIGKSLGVSPTAEKGFTAQGYYQILNSNWARLAPKFGIKAPNAMAASLEDQTKVALALLRESGQGNWTNWNPKLAAAVRRGDKATSAVTVPNLSGGVERPASPPNGARPSVGNMPSRPTHSIAEIDAATSAALAHGERPPGYPLLTPEKAAPIMPSVNDNKPNDDRRSENSESSHRVHVVFDNAPAGMRARIAQSSGNADLNLRTRYSMGVV